MALKVNQISFWKTLKDPKNWLLFFFKVNISLCNVKERFLILSLNVNVFHI